MVMYHGIEYYIFSTFFFIKRILKFSIKLVKIELSTQIKQWMYSIAMLQFFYDCHNSKENIIYLFHMLILYLNIAHNFFVDCESSS